MYVKAVLKCGHHRRLKYSKLRHGEVTNNYYDVARYLEVKDYDDFLKKYKKLAGVKKNGFPILSYKEITKEEYQEGLQRQRKDLYIHCTRDATYKRDVIFAY